MRLFLAALLSLEAAPAFADKNVEAAIHLKVLNYDRSLRTRAADKLVIGVLAPAGHPEGPEMARAFEILLRGRREQGMQARVVLIPIGPEEETAKRLAEANVGVLYLVPALQAETRRIIEGLKRALLPTLCGTRSQVEAGCAVAVVEKNNKPAILINLAASRAAGMDLNAEVLGLAEVIR